MNVLTHKFNLLRGVNRERFADLRLVTECGKSLLLHKVIAASVSKYLSVRLVSSSVSELTIRNVKFSALENLVNFIYNGKIELYNTADYQDLVAAYTLLTIDLGGQVDKLMNRIDPDLPMNDKGVSGEETAVLKCCNCEKTFNDKTKLTRHIREVHNRDQIRQRQKYSCEKCGHVYKVNYWMD